jgi:DNA primase
MMHGRVVIPIHNLQDELIAYASLWPGDEPPEGKKGKYKLPPGFQKLREVFKLHRAKAYAREHGLVLVEGYFGVIRLSQHGICHAVALMGSPLSDTQEQCIVEAVGPHGKVTLLFDGDVSGRSSTSAAPARLSRHIYVKAIHLPQVIQPDKLSEDELDTLWR